MEIKLNKKQTEEIKPILFSDLSIGDIFRYRNRESYDYGMRIISFDIDGEGEYNYIDLEDGGLYYFEPDDEVEKYDNSLELNENSFIKRKKGS